MSLNFTHRAEAVRYYAARALTGFCSHPAWVADPPKAGEELSAIAVCAVDTGEAIVAQFERLGFLAVPAVPDSTVRAARALLQMVRTGRIGNGPIERLIRDLGPLVVEVEGVENTDKLAALEDGRSGSGRGDESAGPA